VGHGTHVVALLDTPLTDGMLALITWRGAMLSCRVWFTGKGYRLERVGASDELTESAFKEQVCVVGRVIATYSSEP
jgi:hypothetical protein